MLSVSASTAIPCRLDSTVLKRRHNESQAQYDDFRNSCRRLAAVMMTVSSEADTFLNDPCRELFTLLKHPTVKQLFLQFNKCLM